MIQIFPSLFTIVVVAVNVGSTGRIPRRLSYMRDDVVVAVTHMSRAGECFCVAGIPVWSLLFPILLPLVPLLTMLVEKVIVFAT